MSLRPDPNVSTRGRSNGTPAKWYARTSLESANQTAADASAVGSDDAQPLTPLPVRWVSPDNIRCFGGRGECSRGDDNWVPCHPREGDDAGSAGRHAGGMRESADQPGAALQHRRHTRSLTRAQAAPRCAQNSPHARHHDPSQRLPISPFGPGQRITGVRLEVIDMRLIAHHFRSGSAH